ncbi:MAG: hypothetical protein A2075_00160 [Geobacteraceae bacterium GWC2_58_44]|nr:MAG: hypothetical protein A2075_00160 [Geobacteraceae bacterium GWC2_58_44]HBG06527.1 hypothetical protein [Geobacter sp.]
MTPSTDCTQNRDPLRLVREGTSQKERLAPALDPAYAPVDQRTVAHRMVFAQAYSAFLKYFNANNAPAGNWQPFFSKDPSVQLAVAAVQDVEFYKTTIKEYFDFLNDRSNELNEVELRNRLGYLFSAAATLAKQLDLLKEGLPAGLPLKGALQNLIQGQLAPAFKKLMLYYRDGLNPDPPPPPDAPYQNDVAATIRILGERKTFKVIRNQGLSPDWISQDSAIQWAEYVVHLDDLLQYPSTKIHGSGATLFERINHIATHNLFTSIFDTLLRAYARTVAEAQLALEATFGDDGHEPHYALFLAYLRLLEYAREEVNTLTARHLDFYYREVLRLKEKAAVPGKAHLLVELAKHAPSFLLKAGELFKAGKDDLGVEAFFANDRDFPANQAKVAELKTLYRHRNGGNETLPFQEGRLFASPVANSDDGMGAELTTLDGSWHPFYNKVYRDASLSEIRMPKADLGFAIASHYLSMAEGKRTVGVAFTVSNPEKLQLLNNHRNDVVCLFSGEKGWLEKGASIFIAKGATLALEIRLTGADPAVVPYASKIHGYDFPTDLPVLLVKLRHLDTADYLYPSLQDVVIEKIDLDVDVQRLKTLAVSNDFGPADTSKPFQPFGAQPLANSALVIGSNEVFQKTLSTATVNVQWQSAPAPYDKETVNLTTEYLQDGRWQPSGIAPIDIVPTDDTPDISIPDPGELSIALRSRRFGFRQGSYEQSLAIWPPDRSTGAKPFADLPDLSESQHYSTSSRQGFIRLKLTDDFGQAEFEQALIDYIKNVIDEVPSSENPKPIAPAGPFISELTVDYMATQAIDLKSAEKSDLERSRFRFLHIAPFGYADETTRSDQPTYLLPQLKHKNELDEKLPPGTPVRHQAEFYLGITDLKPPQNLALLFQVADGTADPLSEKPRPHIHWSYLRDNRWIPFAGVAVQDGTDGLLNSGMVTFAMPRDASDANTVLPSALHWIRGAVASESDAVCRLRLVAAQAVEATFIDKGNDPAFPAKVLEPGSIGKLDKPDAAVKGILQPFPAFGGRGREASTAFHTRVSERLRHKERAIALWDYERLVLEAFPQIYKARCLNHVQYEPNESGTGIYRELAPGHVTVVAIANQQFQNLRDPFRPYTSLAVLEQIGIFLNKRLSCFVRLHVKNPQFEEVMVDFRVRLHEGFDETFYVNKLHEAVSRFLSPWAFPGGGTPSFGGKIYKSVLINFVEEQSYVDYVTDFQLFHRFQDDAGVAQTVEKNEVEGSKAVSILVSARKHRIEILNPAEVEAPGEICPCAA